MNHINTEKNFEQNILAEKRKRWQVYQSLDYFLSFLTYFDFFSSDTFKIAFNSKCFAQACSKTLVTSDLLLFPFFEQSLEISKLLANYNVTKKTYGIALSNVYKTKSIGLKDKLLTKLKKVFFFEKIELDETIKFSYEVNFLFEKASENAFIRFKTPVITPEILFITMMEEKTTTVGKLIKTIIQNDMDWYVLRYKLLKQLHMQEIAIRNEVLPNQQYFAYLLKTQLSEYEFDRLIQNNLLGLGVSFFRNKLFFKILEINLLDYLQKDIYKSIKYNSTLKVRKYSS